MLLSFRAFRAPLVDQVGSHWSPIFLRLKRRIIKVGDRSTNDMSYSLDLTPESGDKKSSRSLPKRRSGSTSIWSPSRRFACDALRFAYPPSLSIGVMTT